MGAGATNYYSFLLRMWQVPTNGEHTWRIQLENVQTGEKSGFTSLEELFSCLCHVTEQENKQLGEGNHTEVQG
jgi:hypothetical protein